MYAEKFTTSVTTASDGTATAYLTPGVTGRVLAVLYTKDGTSPYSAGVDFTITAEGTGEAIVTLTDCNASVNVYPRVPVQDETGANALYAAGGTKLREPVTLVNDRVKLAVAQGGNALVGSFTVIIG